MVHVPDLDNDPVELVEAILEGGPAHFPAELRARQVPHTDEKIKVPHLNGYEHFERDPAARPVDVPIVFRWTGRTRVAE
ncbi:DUF5988 family protein [Dactylosporangium sp. NPDC051485]|uniref:DUF5988 family protein n=1 Tax=Dactylosporangium sp. NPDC051485 TaxID=3154846 RepID=UPI00341B0A1A